MVHFPFHSVGEEQEHTSLHSPASSKKVYRIAKNNPPSRRNHRVESRTRVRRVWKACERCRVKKTKCDGDFPCRKCEEDGLLCMAGARKKVEIKHCPTGYADALENTQHALSATIQKLYAMVRSGQPWTLSEPALDVKGQPGTHAIASVLGCLRPYPDLLCTFPEDTGHSIMSPSLWQELHSDSATSVQDPEMSAADSPNPARYLLPSLDDNDQVQPFFYFRESNSQMPTPGDDQFVLAAKGYSSEMPSTQSWLPPSCGYPTDQGDARLESSFAALGNLDPDDGLSGSSTSLDLPSPSLVDQELQHMLQSIPTKHLFDQGKSVVRLSTTDQYFLREAYGRGDSILFGDSYWT